MRKKLAYLTECQLPSTAAEIIHVLKICDEFENLNYNVDLYVPNLNDEYTNVHYKYNLKNKIGILSLFNKKKKMNFLLRIFYVIKFLKNYKKKKYDIIISRSVLSSLVLNYFKIFNILEIHHEMGGITKFLFNYSKKKFMISHIYFVLIHKNLVKLISSNNFTLKHKILDDAVNPQEFYIGGKIKYEKTCLYTGSFYQGKGIEIVNYLASKCKEVTFHLYGDKSFIGKDYLNDNIKIFDHIPFREIPKKLSEYKILLMPYQSNVSVRSNTKNITSYMSPLKMFEYLAAGRVIMATNLSVYNHILKDEYNSFLFNENEIDRWAAKIYEVFLNYKHFKNIRANSIKTSYMYTWEKRAKEIENLANSY